MRPTEWSSFRNWAWTSSGIATVAVLAVAWLAAQTTGAGGTRADAQGESSGWTSLFDGTTTKGWRGYQQEETPSGWQAQDGALVRVASAGDIVTDAQFGDFELALEWKISEGGNSGVFYRATEEAEKIYWSGPEYQILDNARHPDGKDPKTSAGSCYGLYPAARDVTKPVGEWNETRVVARGPRIEHWMNGAKLLEYEIGSADWKARVAASKFEPHREYGRATRGRIGLQDHGNKVWFRSIRIRTLR